MVLGIVSLHGVDPWIQKCGRKPLQGKKVLSSAEAVGSL